MEAAAGAVGATAVAVTLGRTTGEEVRSIHQTAVPMIRATIPAAAITWPDCQALLGSILRSRART